VKSRNPRRGTGSADRLAGDFFEENEITAEPQPGPRHVSVLNSRPSLVAGRRCAVNESVIIPQVDSLPALVRLDDVPQIIRRHWLREADLVTVEMGWSIIDQAGASS